MLTLLKLFHKIEEVEILCNSLYEATVTLTTKTHKDPTKKKQNYILISFMDIVAKILNKILAN